jgi:hypothetical protein
LPSSVGAALLELVDHLVKTVCELLTVLVVDLQPQPRRVDVVGRQAFDLLEERLDHDERPAGQRCPP